jgi:hypothetical protein
MDLEEYLVMYFVERDKWTGWWFKGWQEIKYIGAYKKGMRCCRVYIDQDGTSLKSVLPSMLYAGKSQADETLGA